MTEWQASEETGAQFERSARVGNEIEPELDVALVVEPRSGVRRFKPPARVFDGENSPRKLLQPAALRAGLGRLGVWRLEQALDVLSCEGGDRLQTAPV